MAIHIRCKSGFTLLELLITVSLISVFALISFQGLNNSIESQNVNNAAKQIAFAINKARYYAKTKGEMTHIKLEENSKTYEITADDISILNANRMDGTSGKLPNHVTITSNNCGDLYFYIDGTPLNSIDPPYQLSHHCTITVGVYNGKSKTISILPYSGSVIYDE